MNYRASVEPRKAGIYAIINIASNRVYVGSSNDMPRRWRDHRWRLNKGTHHASILQRAWIKYGSDAHQFYILEYVNETSALIEREQLWIDALDAWHPQRGFNSLPQAGRSAGLRPSGETREKQRRAKIGIKRQPHSPEHRERIRASMIGMVRGAMSKSHKQAIKRGQARRRRIGGKQLSFTFMVDRRKRP